MTAWTGALRNSLLLFFLLILVISCSGNGITLMVYNVENLFDDVHDGTEYKEFDPAGGAWNTEMYHLRMETIAEVVRKAAPGGPDILALQEVENSNTLSALAAQGLKGLGYSYAIMVPKKGSATNVGMLSRLPVSRVHSFTVSRWNDETARDVVEAEIVSNGHTLHIFDNHWKSKIGGVRETEAARVKSAESVIRRVREILGDDADADVIVAGDLNENMDEFTLTGGRYQTALIPAADAAERYAGSSIFLSGIPGEAGIRGNRLVLYEPWLELARDGRGSYMHDKVWETLDHILLSPGLFDGKGFTYRAGGFRVFRADFLLSSRPAEDAMRAPKGWTGLKGQRGYSDHLPLLMDLDVRD